MPAKYLQKQQFFNPSLQLWQTFALDLKRRAPTKSHRLTDDDARDCRLACRKSRHEAMPQQFHELHGRRKASTQWEELVEVGKYPTLQQAHEHGLVILAMREPSWVAEAESAGEFSLHATPEAVPIARNLLLVDGR